MQKPFQCARKRSGPRHLRHGAMKCKGLTLRGADRAWRAKPGRDRACSAIPGGTFGRRHGLTHARTWLRRFRTWPRDAETARSQNLIRPESLDPWCNSHTEWAGTFRPLASGPPALAPGFMGGDDGVTGVKKRSQNGNEAFFFAVGLSRVLVLPHPLPRGTHASLFDFPPLHQP